MTMASNAAIAGIGIDIVSIERVRKVLNRHPLRFPQRVLHPGERDDYRSQRDPSRFLARRFAAKEAVVKALGLGFSKGAYARRIWIRRDKLGRPSAVLPPDLSSSVGRDTTLLSISDERDYAVAQAIILKRE